MYLNSHSSEVRGQQTRSCAFKYLHVDVLNALFLVISSIRRFENHFISPKEKIKSLKPSTRTEESKNGIPFSICTSAGFPQRDTRTWSDSSRHYGHIFASLFNSGFRDCLVAPLTVSFFVMYLPNIFQFRKFTCTVLKDRKFVRFGPNAPGLSKVNTASTGNQVGFTFN